MADRNYMHVCVYLCVFGVKHVIFLNSSYLFFCVYFIHATIRKSEKFYRKTENLNWMDE